MGGSAVDFVVVALFVAARVGRASTFRLVSIGVASTCLVSSAVTLRLGLVFAVRVSPFDFVVLSLHVAARFGRAISFGRAVSLSACLVPFAVALHLDRAIRFSASFISRIMAVATAAAVRLGRAVVLLVFVVAVAAAASCLATLCLTCCAFFVTQDFCAGLALVVVIGFAALFLVAFVSLDTIAATARLGRLPLFVWSFVVCDDPFIVTAPRFGLLVFATAAAAFDVGYMVALESLGDSVAASRFRLPVVVVAAEAASEAGVVVDVFAHEPRFGLAVFVDVEGPLILDSSCVATPRLGLVAVLVSGVALVLVYVATERFGRVVAMDSSCIGIVVVVVAVVASSSCC